MAGSASMVLREALDPTLAREVDVVLRLLGRYERHGARFHEQRLGSPLTQYDRDLLLAYASECGARREPKSLAPIWVWPRPRKARTNDRQLAFDLGEPANDNAVRRTRRRRA